MKRKTIYRRVIAFATMCTIFGAILPLNPTYVKAYEQKENYKTGVVSLQKENDTYIFGNEYIQRTFNTKDKRLKTDNITNYRTGEKETVLIPESSEEFVINTLENGNENEGFKAPSKKLDTSAWVVTSDSEEKSNEGSNGPASKMFDGDENTYYHSKYKNTTDDELKYPHNIEIDLGGEKQIKSLHYKQRVANGEPTASGHVKDFKLYVADSFEELKAQTEPVFEGKFDDKEDTYINLEKEISTSYIRIEFTSGYEPKVDKTNPNVACCSEFEFFEDEAIFAKESITKIKSSDLILKGKPVEKDVEGGKSLTFSFEPVTARGVEYTISEVITMKHGDSFMRKHLEISVPEGQEEDAKIDYIDLENMDFQDADVVSGNDDKDSNFWTIPEQANNPDMANMKGDYLELGQPYYVGAMYWGCEFPESENKIRLNEETKKQNGFIRYHYGKSLAKDADFEYNENNESGKMITWDAIVGAARSRDYSVVQSDFYEYIETIATDTQFRQQYNSWYDNMKNISADNIQESFYEIEKGFTQHGVNPLDSYVVDDGWINYNSFWDFNEKFPNELYDSSLQVKQLASNFGLWLGPRGGYGTQTTIAKWIQDNGYGSINEQSGSDINISDARYLNKLLKDIFLGYQEKFDINYWKLDGMLLEPSTDKNEYHVTGNPLYTISETYERWTDMYEDMRNQRDGQDLWINMTSYTNPSPWHLQWVNSVWMQNTGDTGYLDKFDASDQQSMLSYRDNSYYKFLNERQWQLPHKYFYNHDPVYGLTANDAYNRPDIEYTDKELREHLYMLGTRGTAFWEYYYSYSMFDDDKWDINAEAAKWIEENFETLQKSKMIGGSPEAGDIYGYSCWNGRDGIISLRNPSSETKTYTVKYDRLIGVAEDTKDVYGKVVIGDLEHQTNESLSYGDEVTYTLKPKEVLILQYGNKDITSAKIDSVHANGNKVEVEFNEMIREPGKEAFIVEDNSVESVLLKEDLRTVELTLKENIADATNIKVSVNGVQDVVGNITMSSLVNDYYENDVVNSIVNRELDGNEINKGNMYAIDGKEGFSITGRLKTTSKNAEIVRQEGSYTLSIDEEGYLTFSLNGMTVNSKYEEKTIQNGSVQSEIKGIIADGEEHQFSAVKEINGMLKLYIDGKLVASVYDENKVNPVIEKGNLVFGKGLEGTAKYITLMDKALAYDEVANYIDLEGNVISRKVNPQLKISAYDVTEGKTITEKSDKPFGNINDGNKDTNSYLELKDTTDGKNHSRYVEFDLGTEYELSKLHLTRYFQDNRTYGPTVISLSNDKEFTDQTIVYNSDKSGNVHNLGKGTDELYKETKDGKEITLQTPVSARYIRIYVNGRTDNAGTSDHLVEFEAYGTKKSESVYRIDYSHLESVINEELSDIYTKSSIKEYEKVAADTLKEAKELLKNKNASSDSEVEDLVSALQEHRTILEKRADITEAQVLLDKLNVEELKEKDFTADSWKVFITAKENLENSIKDTSDINDAQMAELVYATEKARKNLVKLGTEVNVEILEKLYNDYVTLKQNNYTDESYNALQTALKEAKGVIDNENRTEEEVDKAYSNLIEAIQSLKVKDSITGDTGDIGDTGDTGDTVYTGDTTNIAGLMLLFAVSGGVLVVIAYKKKKRLHA